MPVIETESTSCLVRLHSHSECRRCQDVCPVSAITIEKGQVLVDHSACLGCGLCLSACPTSVFSVRGLDLNALLDNLVGGAGDTLTLRCACTAEDCESAQRDSRVLPCVGMLGEELVLALAGRGVRTLVLQTGDGERCGLRARALVGSMVDRACERWPGRMDVKMQEELDAPGVAFSTILGNLLDLNAPRMDRRTFLRGILDRAKTAVDDPPVQEKKWGDRPLPTRVPTVREILLASVLEDDPVVFPRIAISSKCDDCQDAHSLCSRFCPSGALTREEGRTNVEFVFRPELCVDCGQCEFVCPQNAISRQGEEPGRGPLILQEFQCGTCSKCGKEAAHMVDGLCDTCSRDSKLKDYLTEWVQQPK